MQVFAPANLRAAADNKPYADFVSVCIADKYTLRYTGGFVPDINHIMAKVTSLAVFKFQNNIFAYARAREHTAALHQQDCLKT